MDISASGNIFFASALVFSGRKNPSWEVQQGTAEKALLLFQDAPAAADDNPAASLLGYNGLQLKHGNKLWHAMKGRIFFKVKDETVLVKEDPDRRFEQMLLRTAPREIAELLAAMGE